MEKLGDFLLSTIFCFLPTPSLIATLQFVSKTFHRVVTNDSLWQSITTDKEFLVEYPAISARTYNHFIVYLKEVVAVRRAWANIEDKFEASETSFEQANAIATIRERLAAKADKAKEIKLPLGLRVSLQDRISFTTHEWRRTSYICDMFSVGDLFGFGLESSIYDPPNSSGWLVVAGEGETYALLICCDTTSEFYGMIIRYNVDDEFSPPKSVDDILCKNFIGWLNHVAEKAHIYDDYRFVSDDESNPKSNATEDVG